MEQDTKELKFKLKVLEKLLVLGVDEKELSNMGALDFWAIYRTSKFSEREGDMLIELAETIGKKQLYRNGIGKDLNEILCNYLKAEKVLTEKPRNEEKSLGSYYNAEYAP